ncbi:MAG: galactose oxidase-like domain-containing protein, partial [Nitrospirota bacterium]
GIDATAAVDVIDLKAAHPQFHAAAPMNLPRTHVNAVLLPDRTVLATGGGLKREDVPTATLQPEIYDPTTNTWIIGASSKVPRLYHSVALLLPDGRVVAAGGNPDPGTHVEWNNDPNEEMRLDVYSPPYLFKGPRPVITAAPEEWHYGQAVDISSPQAGDIRWASLIKNGVTTHSFDTGQRLVDLPIATQGDGMIRVTLTGAPNIAPPGGYMLFLTNNKGIPSVAHWVHVT